MKKLPLLIIFTSFGLSVFSQPSRREIISDLLPLGEIGNSIAKTLLMQSPVFHNRTGVTERQIREITDQFIHAGNDALTDSLLNIYDSLLSDSEIQQLEDLSCSTVVREFLNLIPVISMRSIRAVHNWYLSNQEILTSLLDSAGSWYPEFAKPDFIYTETELNRGKPYAFRKKNSAKSAYINEENTYKVHYNDKIWSEINPSLLNPSADVAFKMSGKEVYAIIVAESNDLNFKELRYAAIYNLYHASSMYEVISNELRKVNSNEFLSVQFKAVVDDIEINYHNYYYTGNKHVIQFSTFSGSGTYETEKDIMEDLLNGLVIIK